ncbi:glycosyltransferase family protein [Geomonas ferrireducens]|uniref:glycosyltransferase family protein n=1 Tax=Geomonas ferrireducens TaxID=2570227 RepID=UPI0010A7C35A|nr:glycosyltransferase [Geomonas ferrireducens]
MKIFYLSVIEQHAGWGAEVFVNRAFVGQGHRTVTLDYRKHRHDLSRHFLALDGDFDVLFLQRGDWFPIELLKSVRRPRFFWASELVSRNEDQNRLLRSGLFQHIFVHSKQCKDIVVRNGWMPEHAVSVLLNGFDESVHFAIPAAEKDIDLLFLGNLTPRRRRWLERLKADFPVTIVNAFGSEMTQFLNRAKIVLNIHAEEYPDTETRVFEALGCGAFLLTETLSAENPFSDLDHLVQVEDVEQMAAAISHYLEHGQQRQRIADSGHRAALAGHTYAKRAEWLAGIFLAHASATSAPALDRKKVAAYSVKEGVIRQLASVKRLIDASVVAKVSGGLAGARGSVGAAVKARRLAKGSGRSES